MSRTRKNYPASFKAKVALAADLSFNFLLASALCEMKGFMDYNLDPSHVQITAVTAGGFCPLLM